ncbi:MAG: archease [Armatimonadetes bacterium]|nr:archease [Armatimonadota bacterium]
MNRDFLPFEIVEHTADVGIIAYGRDYRELLENAALGMFSLMADLKTVAPREEREVIAEASLPEREWLLLRWLKELHYLKEVEKFVPREVKVTEVTETTVKGIVKGEKLHDGIVLLHHVKAVTHHMMNIEQVGDLLRVQVIFDV